MEIGSISGFMRWLKSSAKHSWCFLRYISHNFNQISNSATRRNLDCKPLELSQWVATPTTRKPSDVIHWRNASDRFSVQRFNGMYENKKQAFNVNSPWSDSLAASSSSCFKKKEEFKYFCVFNTKTPSRRRRRWRRRRRRIKILTDYADFPCWFEEQTTHDGILSTTHHKFSIVLHRRWKA